MSEDQSDLKNLNPPVTVTGSAPIEEPKTGENNPEDHAAAFFSMNEKVFINLLSKTSLRGLKRVIYNVATYPIGSRTVNLQEDEKQLAYIFNEMVLNRSIMQLHLEMEKVNKGLEETKPEGESNGV